MASILDNLLLHAARRDPLSDSDTSPTSTTSFNHGLGYSRWNSNGNIWDSTSKPFKYASNEAQTPAGGSSVSMLCGGGSTDRHLAFPTGNNSVTVPDTSKPVARASVAEIHNTNATKSAGPFSTSLSTMPSGQSVGMFASPTRLRGGSTAGPDSNVGANSLNRPSLLLLGSHPDNEPSNSSPSRSTTFGERRGSAIGRQLLSFDSEDIDGFASPGLQESESYSRYNNAAYVYNSSHLQSNRNGASIDYPNISRGPSSTQQRLQPGDRSFHSLVPNGIARGTPIPDHLKSRQPYRSAPHRDSDTGMQPDTSTHQLRTAPQHLGEYDNDQTASTIRKRSVLRPDVASYQPSGFNRSFESNATWRTDASYSNGVAPFIRAPFDNTRPSRTDRNMASRSAGMQTKTPPLGPATFYSNFTNVRQQLPHSYSSRASTVDHAQPYPGFDGQFHASEYTEPMLAQAAIGTQNSSESFYQPSAQPLHNNGHYRYMPEMPRTMFDEQLYGHAQTTGAAVYMPDVSYPRDSESRETRSELLEEFRACHKSRKYELKDIFGHIVEFSGDQNGSRFIQGKLEQATSEEKEQIFSELQADARQLMTDCFGNYVIQKMFEYGNQSQKKILASSMQGYVLRLSLHAYGCRCVQKAFEHILTDQQAMLIKELEGQVLCVVESQHGNHVIQKAVECMPAEHIQFIVDAHKNQVIRLSKNIYGCRIIQRMLEHCTPNAKRAILDELYGAIPALIDDQYGNYVIQCIISKCGPTDRYHAIEFVLQRLFFYSTHKFASNVVEKAIQHAEEAQRTELIRRLTSPHPDFGMQSPVMSLLKDQFGNYVIQTVLKNTSGPTRKSLMDEIRHHINFMGKNGRSKQVVAMADMLAVITAGHSPSSTSTGPHTPRTPTSLHHDGGVGAPMSKDIDIDAPGYATREQPGNAIDFKSLHL